MGIMDKIKTMQEALEKIAYAEDTICTKEKSDYDCFEECIFIAQRALSKVIKNYCLRDDCIHNLNNTCSIGFDVDSIKDCSFKSK